MPAVMLTVSEAAQRLGISRGLAYLLARNGEIPALRVGERRIVVPADALERWIAENTLSGVAAGPSDVA